MKAGDLLQQVRFPEFGLERWRLAAEKALGGAAFEDALVARTDDGIRIEPLMPRAQRCLATRGAHPSAIAMDRHAAHRRSRPVPRQPAGAGGYRRRARPASRWSSRARRTRSATGCPPSRNRWRSRCTTCRSTASTSGSTCIRQAAPASTGWWRCSASGAPIRPSSASPSASTRRRSSPAPAGCACRSRRCRRRCRNRSRISSCSACRASCSKATAASSTMPARPRRRNSASRSRPPSRICACSRRRARRWSMPRRISAFP